VDARPQKKFDVGDGPGKPLKKRVRGGVVGLVLDGRGRPVGLQSDIAARNKQLIEWGEAMGSYDNVLSRVK
jgi:hypothetical protein